VSAIEHRHGEAENMFYKQPWWSTARRAVPSEGSTWMPDRYSIPQRVADRPV